VAAISTDVRSLTDVAAGNFAEQFSVTELGAFSLAQGDFGDILGDINTGLVDFVSVDLLPDFNSLNTILNNTVDFLLLNDVVTLVNNVQQFLNIPALAVQNYNSLKERYRNLSDDILNTYPNETLSNALRKNQCAHAEFIGGFIVSSLATAITNTTFTTRVGALTALNDVTIFHDTYLEKINEYEELFDGVLADESYAANRQALEVLDALVSNTARVLISSSFTLQTQRTVVVDRARTPIDLAYELYGNQNDLFDRVNEIIENNVLNNPTLIEEGTEILYYV
jgi:hypothetical protein